MYNCNVITTARCLPWPHGSNLSLSPSVYSSKQMAQVSYGSPGHTTKQQRNWYSEKL